ncbi:MAG: glycosyltransferase family 4 protein [Burkholderiales bacterium]
MANAIQFMNYCAPYPGNFMRSMLALERALENAGSTCVFVFPAAAERFAWVNELHQAGKRIFFATGRVVKDARLLVLLVERYRIGVLHSHFASAGMLVAIRLARLACPEVGWVAHVHNHEQGRSRLKNLVKRTLVAADCYVGVSEHVRADLLARGYDPRKCVSVPNAVDFSRLGAAAAAPAPAQDGRKKLLMFGFDFERKGVDVALEALSRHDAGHEMLLLIVLAANFHAVRARIEGMFGRVPSWVELLPPTDNVATYYRMAEVFISPSREEGLPYALIEAAYCGLRLVASDIGGQTSLGIPGLGYFKSEDPRSLYDALKAENSSPAAEARDYVVKRFRLEKWVRDIVGLYAGLPSRGGALPRYRTP